MALAEQIEHGKIAKLFNNGKGRMRYRRFLKKYHKRILRRLDGTLKPMYNRFRGWEY